MELLIPLMVSVFLDANVRCWQDISGTILCNNSKIQVNELIDGSLVFEGDIKTRCREESFGSYTCDNGVLIEQGLIRSIIFKEGYQQIETCRRQFIGPLTCKSGRICRKELGGRITCQN